MMAKRFLIALTMLVASGSVASAQGFVRGDVDGNLVVNKNDVTMLTDSIFASGTLNCTLAADANDDGIVDIADVTALVDYLFLGGTPPPPPFPLCGPDPTAPMPGTSCCVIGAPVFIRGDADANGIVDTADAIMILNSVFAGGPLNCALAADANDDGSINTSDFTIIVSFVNFGTILPPPFPVCGQDPTLPAAGASCCGVGCCNLPGDANNDGSVNIADITFLIARIFAGGPPPPCCEEGSANADGSVNIADITYLIARIFAGGPLPFCGRPGMGC